MEILFEEIGTFIIEELLWNEKVPKWIRILTFGMISFVYFAIIFLMFYLLFYEAKEKIWYLRLLLLGIDILLIGIYISFFKKVKKRLFKKGDHHE